MNGLNRNRFCIECSLYSFVHDLAASISLAQAGGNESLGRALHAVWFSAPPGHFVAASRMAGLLCSLYTRGTPQASPNLHSVRTKFRLIHRYSAFDSRKSKAAASARRLIFQGVSRKVCWWITPLSLRGIPPCQGGRIRQHFAHFAHFLPPLIRGLSPKRCRWHVLGDK